MREHFDPIDQSAKKGVAHGWAAGVGAGRAAALAKRGAARPVYGS